MKIPRKRTISGVYNGVVVGMSVSLVTPEIKLARDILATGKSQQISEKIKINAVLPRSIVVISKKRFEMKNLIATLEDNDDCFTGNYICAAQHQADEPEWTSRIKIYIQDLALLVHWSSQFGKRVPHLVTV